MTLCIFVSLFCIFILNSWTTETQQSGRIFIVWIIPSRQRSEDRHSIPKWLCGDNPGYGNRFTTRWSHQRQHKMPIFRAMPSDILCIYFVTEGINHLARNWGGGVFNTQIVTGLKSWVHVGNHSELQNRRPTLWILGCRYMYSERNINRVLTACYFLIYPNNIVKHDRIFSGADL